MFSGKLGSKWKSYFDGGIQQLSKWKPVRDSSLEGEIQVIDLFSGCGGMSLGFAALSQSTQAYKMIGAGDINPVSLATYKHNFNVPAILQDVRELASSADARDQFLKKLKDYDSSKPLVLIGCAPCQGFTAHRKKRWDEADHRNTLVDDFAEVAVALEPECVVMENVPELLSGRYWHHFESFASRLEEVGYTVKYAIHSAAEFGTPQERFRALVIAMKKKDFAMPESVLEPDKYLTVRDAIGDLPEVPAGKRCDTDTMHKSAAHRASTIEVIKSVSKDGGSRPKGIGPKCLDKVNGFYDVYGRLYWDRPSITITHYARNPASGRFTHPEQNRGLTMRESSRLQGFPDGFEFKGTFDNVFRQIGEAVPPPLSVSVAATVFANIQGETSCCDVVDRKPVNDSFGGVIANIKKAR